MDLEPVVLSRKKVTEGQKNFPNYLECFKKSHISKHFYVMQTFYFDLYLPISIPRMFLNERILGNSLAKVI